MSAGNATTRSVCRSTAEPEQVTGAPLHVVLPAGVDDRARPSGGNVYDRRLCQDLAGHGWAVREHQVPGGWPQPDDAARTALSEVISGIPDGSVVLLDGLVASALPQVLVRHRSRLRLVVLVHMLLADGRPGAPPVQVRTREHAALSAAAAVITTSRWTRRRVLEVYRLPSGRVHVAHPGVDGAPPSPGTDRGTNFLCVASVMPQKGHDVLLSALSAVRHLAWQCTFVGSLDRDPAFVARLQRQIADDGLSGRVRLTGPRTGPALARAYAAADVLLLASHAETYGMVVTEALSRGLPVITSAVGGLPEAVGRGADGRRPGLLVPPGDPAALAAELRSWLTDPDLRRQLRETALQRRAGLSDWRQTAARVSAVLTSVSG